MSAEVHLTKYTKMSGDLLGFAAPMHVWLWDCGPEQPMLPDPPEAPSGKAGDPQFDLAKLKFKRALRATRKS